MHFARKQEKKCHLSTVEAKGLCLEALSHMLLNKIRDASVVRKMVSCHQPKRSPHEGTKVDSINTMPGMRLQPLCLPSHPPYASKAVINSNKLACHAVRRHGSGNWS